MEENEIQIRSTRWTKTDEAAKHSMRYQMGFRARWEDEHGWAIEKRHYQGRRQHHPFERINRDQRAGTDFRIIDAQGHERTDTASTLKGAKQAVEVRREYDRRHAQEKIK